MIKYLLQKYFQNKFQSSIVEKPKANLPQEEKSRYKVETDTVKILAHPGNSQLDNKFSPRSACNVTSLQIAMSLDVKITDDDLFILCNSNKMRQIIKTKYPKDYNSWIKNYFDKGCANEVWVVLLQAAVITLGENYAKIIFNLTQQTIINEIDLGYPVVVNGKFTHAGHFVTIVGYDRNRGDWIVNDPFGDWTTNYKSRQVENLRYPMGKLIIGEFLSRMAILIHADRRIPV